MERLEGDSSTSDANQKVKQSLRKAVGLMHNKNMYMAIFDHKTS